MKNLRIPPFAEAALLFVIPLSPVGTVSPARWVQARNPNFIVVSNAVEGRVSKTVMRANAPDSRVQEDANQVDYLCLAYEYESHNLSAEDAAPRASSQHASGNASAAASPKVELLPQDLRADGIATKVLCRGNAMQVTIARAKTQSPLTLHATDRTKVDYTSDVPIKSGDIEPCTELKGHTVHIVYRVPKTKAAQGEIARIRVEK
jgi:hypothetical protein